MAWKVIGKMTIQEIEKLFRPLAVKWLTRGAMWLLTTVAGMTTYASESYAVKIGAGAATLLFMAISIAIDKWHHKKDLAEPPKE